MSWSKPFTEVELAYIEKAWPKVGCAAIARKLGRSTRGVEKKVSQMGLRERRAQARAGAAARAEPSHADPPEDAPSPAPAPDGGRQDEMQDELRDLRELKRILRRTLKDDIDPKSIPKLSAEYREVLKRIDELEGGGDGGGTVAGDGPGSLLVSIPLRTA